MRSMLEKTTHTSLQTTRADWLRHFLDLARDYLGLAENASPGEDKTTGRPST